MRRLLTGAALMLLAGACGAGPQEAGPPALPIPPADALFGVFEGRVPSGPDGLQKTKIALTLLRDPALKTPTEAWMQWIPVPPDEIVRHVWRGTWRLEKGTPHDDRAPVIVLSDSPAGLGAFQAVGGSLLLGLDADRRPRVGNAAWNYTLSRTHGGADGAGP